MFERGVPYFCGNFWILENIKKVGQNLTSRPKLKKCCTITRTVTFLENIIERAIKHVDHPRVQMQV